MMKNSFFILAFTILGTSTAYSQTGNVGINTSTTTNTLTVNGNTSVGTGYIGVPAPVNGAAIEGNVGIGTSAPAAKLDVIGKVKITDGTEGAGKILTSDINGVASWQPAPGSVVVTGNINQAQNFTFVTPPTTELIADSPITLNKGVYTLYYYVQFDYFQPGSTTVTRDLNITSNAALEASFPKFIYFNFITSSGSADFPSYPGAGGTSGPHVIPIISHYQAASKISQLVIVNQDNTVIRPRYWGISAHGRVSNIGAIIAVKM